MAYLLKRFAVRFFLIACMVLTTPLFADAQTGDDMLDSYLVELQGTPTNSRSEKALQENIIQFVQGMATPPPIPSTARRFMIRGETALEMIPGKEGNRRAAGEFREASRSAPWWPEAHYELAQAEENAGNLAGAIAAYKMYQRAAPGATNTMDVEAKIFKLEYQLEIGALPTRAKANTRTAATAPPPPPEMTGRELLFYIQPADTPQPKNMKSVASDFRYSAKYRLTGKALVQFDIDEKGRTNNFKVVKATRSEMYDNFAKKVVRKLRFPANSPKSGVLFDLGFCVKSDKISPIICTINFEKINKGTGGEPFLLSYSYPYYNQNAANKGVCGDIVVRFDVGDDGTVKNMEVVSSSRSGQFELNTKDALEKFRFEKGRAATGIEYRISFGLPGRCEAP